MRAHCCLAVVACLLLASAAGAVEVVQVKIIIDDTDHFIPVSLSDEENRQKASAFCQERGLLHVEEQRSGSGCVSAVTNVLAAKKEASYGLQTADHILDIISPVTVFPYHVQHEKLQRSITTAENNLVLSAYLFGHDASLVSICNGRVLGVLELERVVGERYFDLSLKSEQKYPGNETLQLPMIKLYLRRALDALDDMTFTPENEQRCPSSISLKSKQYDAIIFVDAQTRPVLQDALKSIVPMSNRPTYHVVNHHYSHALYGWYDSPFFHAQRDATSSGSTLILSYDGFGNDGSFMFYHTVPGNSADPINALRLLTSRPLSLGQTYIAAATLLPHFWSNDGQSRKPPCKYTVKPSCQLALPGILMAYASLGKVRSEWLEGVKTLLIKGDFDKTKMPPLDPSVTENHLLLLNERGQRDFAATVQSAFENIVIEEVRGALDMLDQLQQPAEHLVIVGGCALNVRVNTILQNKFRLPVYVPSSPGDSGIAIGGGWHYAPPPMHEPLEYLGAPLFDRDSLPAMVDKYSAVRTSPAEVAGLLGKGRVGAIVRGRQEVGPRALGHRSIIAIPRNTSMKERMNRIKKRAWYRPTAPVITEESTAQIFENFAGGVPIKSPYMSFAPFLKDWVVDAFPAIAHVDGTARPQTVSASRNPWLHKLLLLIGDMTGAPILINTSFNAHGEPIVNTVKDTLDLLWNSEDLDFVVIEDFLFTKKETSWRKTNA
jgi:carbamoyltransferase